MSLYQILDVGERLAEIVLRLSRDVAVIGVPDSEAAAIIQHGVAQTSANNPVVSVDVDAVVASVVDIAGDAAVHQPNVAAL